MSPNSQLQAARAANRDVSNVPPSPFQDCSDVVHLSFYFDGTGNNKDEDASSQKWSNVSRLFEAARDDKNKAIYRIYISGVGTPFNGKSDWWERLKVWGEDKIGGNVAGAGGDRRLDSGGSNLSDRLRSAMIFNANKAGGELAKYAKSHEADGFSQLNKALGKHRLIKYINVSIFGFSRGAALARAFSNRLLSKCKEENGGLTFEGYPIRFVFMGLFDTVASFGVPAQNARLPWDERDLRVSSNIERVVHFIAGHELRFSFPVDLIRLKGQYVANWLEKVYPGVHSDVGGGYEPVEQGLSDNLARVPLGDMLQQALGAGVRIFDLKTLENKYFPIYQRFEIKEKTKNAYMSYQAALGGTGGSIEQQIEKHMALFYSAIGTLTRNNTASAGDKIRSASFVKTHVGPAGMSEEISAFKRAIETGKNVALTDSGKQYWYYFKTDTWKLDAWNKNASNGVVELLNEYVHDSKVDFVGNAEPFSYFRSRGVNESTASVWQDAGSLVEEKRKQALHGIDVAKQKANDTYEKSKKVAADTARKAENIAVDAYKKTEKIVGETYDATERTAVEVYGKAEHATKEGVSKAEMVMTDVGKTVQGAVLKTAQTVKFW